MKTNYFESLFDRYDHDNEDSEEEGFLTVDEDHEEEEYLNTLLSEFGIEEEEEENLPDEVYA